MPHGHEPEGMFTVPHFDVNSYMMTEAKRLAIDPAAPRFLEKAANRPAAVLVPANYMPPPAPEPIPAMGEHWVNVTDPVLAGQPFEAVLIYGAWEGEVTFVEPMVTRDLLFIETIEGEAFLIQGEPVRDRGRLIWTVDLRPK